MKLILKWLLSASALLLVAYLYNGVEVRSFGAALMAEALTRLAKTDCRQVLATIDERNGPSIQLHERFGFERQPERYYLFRRTA